MIKLDAIGWFVILCACTCALSGDVTPFDCEAEFKAAEQCFDTLMIGAKAIYWTKENAKSICTAKFEALDCIQNYRRKCVTGMSSMVFTMIGKKFNSTFNYLCNNDTALNGKFAPNVILSTPSF